MPENGRKLMAIAAEMLIEARAAVESAPSMPLRSEIVGDIDKAIEKAKDLSGQGDASD